MPMFVLVGAIPVRVRPERLIIMSPFELFWIKRYPRFLLAAAIVTLVALAIVGVVSTFWVGSWFARGMCFSFPAVAGENVGAYP